MRLYWDLMDCPAWRALSHADVRVYLAMRRKLGKTNNGNVEATLGNLKHSGINSSSTLSTALHRLEALGFIDKVRQGGIAYGGKVCSLYRFTDVETYEIPKIDLKAGPPSNEWKKFQTISEARFAIRRFEHKNKTKVRESKQTDSVIELTAARLASVAEQVPSPPVRLSNASENRKRG